MSKKTIQINEDFLKLSSSSLNNNTTNNKTLKNKERKEKPQMIIKPNNIKKQLLQKIKNYQNKDDNNNSSDLNYNTPSSDLDDPSTAKKEEDEDFSSEFNKSLNFLQNLSLQKNTPQNKPSPPASKKNKTLKKQHEKKETQALTDLPPELSISTIPFDRAVHKNSAYVDHNISDIVSHTISGAPIIPSFANTIPDQIKISEEFAKPAIVLKEPPSYGILKNGLKPTYRQVHNKTYKKSATTSTKQQEIIQPPPITFSIDNEVNPNIRDVKNDSSNFPVIETSTPIIKEEEEPKIFKRKITRTMKYKLGKKGNKVAVLIKNAKTRKLIQHEQAVLKSKSILDIKNYLRKKNLLKIGSDAPPDILRQIYENSILAGDLENKSKETLIHNYMNTK